MGQELDAISSSQPRTPRNSSTALVLASQALAAPAAQDDDRPAPAKKRKTQYDWRPFVTEPFD
eukprot:4124369-Pyramimonas_sp.AAC.1